MTRESEDNCWTTDNSRWQQRKILRQLQETPGQLRMTIESERTTHNCWKYVVRGQFSDNSWKLQEPSGQLPYNWCQSVVRGQLLYNSQTHTTHKRLMTIGSRDNSRTIPYDNQESEDNSGKLPDNSRKTAVQWPDKSGTTAQSGRITPWQCLTTPRGPGITWIVGSQVLDNCQTTVPVAGQRSDNFHIITGQVWHDSMESEETLDNWEKEDNSWITPMHQPGALDSWYGRVEDVTSRL